MSPTLVDLLPAVPGPASATPGSGVAALLAAQRQAASEALSTIALPSTDEEAWRYSPVADLDLGAFSALGDRPADAGSPAASSAEGPVPDPLLARAAAVVDVVDGFVVGLRVAPAAEAAGLVVAGGAHEIGDTAVPKGAAEPLGALLALAPADAFAVFATAGAPDPIVIVVPAGVVVDGPVVVVQRGSGAAAAVPTHLVVVAGTDAELTVVEWLDRTAPGALVAAVTDVAVAAAARVRLVQVQDHHPTARQIANLRAVVDRDATFGSFHAGLGGAYVRQRTDCRLIGAGAAAKLDAVFLGHADQVLDFRTFQTHAARNTTSNLEFTGAVGGRARSVYTGLIRIEPEARGSSAFQTNRNLKLSDDAWADSVPNLEIENNDVKCSHASTVGPVDPDQRFYLESRGVPTAVAERLVVEGFLADGVGACPVPEVATFARAQIADRLDADGVIA